MAATIDQIGGIPHIAQELDGWLKNGKPELGWRGDPRLELRIGVLQAQATGVDPHTKRWQRQGDTVAWRWEIWRHNEDGTDTRILQRPADKMTELIPELIRCDPRTPGFEPVMDRVEKAEAAVERERSRRIQEAVGEQTEHLWKLVADRQNGKTTFRGMPGSNPDKQL
jgi:hypothetical protein